MIETEREDKCKADSASDRENERALHQIIKPLTSFFLPHATLQGTKCKIALLRADVDNYIRKDSKNKRYVASFALLVSYL